MSLQDNFVRNCAVAALRHASGHEAGTPVQLSTNAAPVTEYASLHEFIDDSMHILGCTAEQENKYMRKYSQRLKERLAAPHQWFCYCDNCLITMTGCTILVNMLATAGILCIDRGGLIYAKAKSRAVELVGRRESQIPAGKRLTEAQRTDAIDEYYQQLGDQFSDRVTSPDACLPVPANTVPILGSLQSLLDGEPLTRAHQEAALHLGALNWLTSGFGRDHDDQAKVTVGKGIEVRWIEPCVAALRRWADGAKRWLINLAIRAGYRAPEAAVVQAVGSGGAATVAQAVFADSSSLASCWTKPNPAKAFIGLMEKRPAFRNLIDVTPPYLTRASSTWSWSGWPRSLSMTRILPKVAAHISLIVDAALPGRWDSGKEKTVLVRKLLCAFGKAHYGTNLFDKGGMADWQTAVSQFQHQQRSTRATDAPEDHLLLLIVDLERMLGLGTGVGRNNVAKAQVLLKFASSWNGRAGGDDDEDDGDDDAHGNGGGGKQPPVCATLAAALASVHQFVVSKKKQGAGARDPGATSADDHHHCHDCKPGLKQLHPAQRSASCKAAARVLNQLQWGAPTAASRSGFPTSGN